MSIDKDGFLVPVAVKDDHAAHPVAASWRGVLADIICAFVREDYSLSTPIAGVAPVPLGVAEQIRAYVLDYGATLVNLPSETWETSCAQWMGEYWTVLVDLWTQEETRSDLVLELQVVECGAEYRFTIKLVYVP